MLVMKEVKEAIRKPFCWPGGYAKVLLMQDGGAMHVRCAHECFGDICQAHYDGGNYGWEVEEVFVNWEDTSLWCCQCNERITSEYAEDNSEQI